MIREQGFPLQARRFELSQSFTKTIGTTSQNLPQTAHSPRTPLLWYNMEENSTVYGARKMTRRPGTSKTNEIIQVKIAAAVGGQPVLQFLCREEGIVEDKRGNNI